MSTDDLRIASYFAGPIAGYWGVWAFRGLADETASAKECRRGALIVGLIAAVPLFILATRGRHVVIAETLAAAVYVVYSLLIATIGDNLRAYLRGERRVPSMWGLAFRALALPATAFVLGMGAAAGLQKMGVSIQPSYTVFPILQGLAIMWLAKLMLRAGRGYWMLLPAVGLLCVTLFIAIVGAPMG